MNLLAAESEQWPFVGSGLSTVYINNRRVTKRGVVSFQGTETVETSQKGPFIYNCKCDVMFFMGTINQVE